MERQDRHVPRRQQRQQSQPVSRRWLPRLETPARRAVAIVGGIATLIAATTGAIQLWQAMTDEGPTPAAAMTLVGGVTPEMTWAEFRRAHPEAGDASIGDDVAGVVHTVDLKIDGMKGRTGHLRWRELDRGGADLKLPPGTPTAIAINPDSNDSKFVQTVWAPLPPVVEAFVVEFSFVDQAGVTRSVVVGPEVTVGRY